jgi:hypothetical protein
MVQVKQVKDVPSMAQLLDGIEAKVVRAKEHMRACWKIYKETLRREPITFKLEPDAQPGFYLGQVESVPALPLTLGVAVGDVLHNFRSAIDHLVWQAALLHTDSPYEQSKFPITDSPSKFQRAKESFIADLAPEEQAIVEQFQPYSRGGIHSPLRVLRDLSNRDKHRVINVVLVRAGIFGASFHGRNCAVEGDPKWISDGHRLDAGDAFVRLRISGDFDEPDVEMRGQVVPRIGFDNGDETFLELMGIGSEVVIVASEFESLIEPRPLMTRGRSWPTFSTFPDPSWRI